MEQAKTKLIIEDVSGKELEIETKPITIICKSPEILEKIKYKNVLPIHAKDGIYHASLVKKIHPKTLEFFFIVFPHLSKTWPTFDKLKTLNCWSTEIENCDEGVQSVFGCIDLILKFTDMKVQTVWIRPETGLHPKWCCNLGDLVIVLSEYMKSDVDKLMTKIYGK
jgi:hypothetical protein